MKTAFSGVLHEYFGDKVELKTQSDARLKELGYAPRLARGWRKCV